MKAKKFDRDFDAGKSVAGSLDLAGARRPLQKQRQEPEIFPYARYRHQRALSFTANLRCDPITRTHYTQPPSMQHMSIQHGCGHIAVAKQFPRADVMPGTQKVVFKRPA